MLSAKNTLLFPCYSYSHENKMLITIFNYRISILSDGLMYYAYAQYISPSLSNSIRFESDWDFKFETERSDATLLTAE